MAASGPLTVFAPRNAAFDSSPKGTLDELLQPESADDLREILEYHLTTSALAVETFRDGQKLGLAKGDKATIHVDGDTVTIEGATLVVSIPAENDPIHVVDAVLLPPDES